MHIVVLKVIVVVRIPVLLVQVDRFVLLECVKDQLISLDAIDSILDKRFSRALSDTIDEEALKDFFKYELLDDEEFINKYPEVNKRFE